MSKVVVARCWAGLMAAMVVLIGGLTCDAAPLKQDELITLMKLGIDDAAVVAKIQKEGVAFEVNETVLKALKEAGVSEAVLKAVEEAAKKSRPAASAITYQDVLTLLQLGIDESAIRQRLEKSPTVFTLSPQQIGELKRAGASEALIAALQGVRQPPSQVAELITDMAVILDCSGSMREATTGGRTKMEVAQGVVTDLVRGMPDGLNLTFVIYGHEVFGATDPRNCQAVKIARPLGALDAAGKAQLVDIISRLAPTGATPIALSLKTAGQELARYDRYCGVVLITDGLETCMGDPAAEAAALAQNPKLTFGVNVVGFDVKQEESTALKTIADAGKGKYYNAASAEELAAAIAAIGTEIQSVAAKPEVVDTSRRALRILKPAIELPPMKEVFLIGSGEFESAVYTKTGTVQQLGEYLAIPSSSRKYDVVWVPQTGRPVYLMREFVLPERRVVDVKPETILGMIQVNGNGTPRAVFVMPAGKKPQGVYRPVQQVEKFGDILIVPAGEYDVYVIGADSQTTLLEEGLIVEAGKLHRLQ